MDIMEITKLVWAITITMVVFILMMVVISRSIVKVGMAYDIGYRIGKQEACKDVNDISYSFRTATCEEFRDE